MSSLEDLQITTGRQQPRVVFNARTGTIVIGEGVVGHRDCVAAMRKAGYAGYVNIEYENGAVVNFLMALNVGGSRGSRNLAINGTKGSIWGDIDQMKVTSYVNRTDVETEHTKERHDDRVLGRFFRLCNSLRAYCPFRQVGDIFLERHDFPHPVQYMTPNMWPPQAASRPPLP